MQKRTIASNYIFNLSYQVILVLIPLLITPYLTRVLGAENLGIYSYTYSIVTIFFLLAALGINTYGQRETAYVQDNRKKRTNLFWELFFIRIISTIFSVALIYILSILTKEYNIYYKIFIVYIISNLFDITWLYQGMEDFKNVTIRNFFVKIIYVISIFIFVKSQNDLWIYILLFSLSYLITNISFWLGLNKIIDLPKLSDLNLKRHYKYIIAFFIPQVANLIYTVLDKTMIGLIVPDISNVSFYEQATFIDKTILMFITTIGTVMISRISYEYENKNYNKIKDYLFKIINFVWFAGVPLTFGVCAVIRNFVPWFYSPEYNSVINLVYVLSPLIIIMGLNNIIGIQYLIPTKQQNKYIIAVSIGAFTNFILNLILIKLFGTVGAAISTIVAEFVILAVELYFVRDNIKVKDIFKNSHKYLFFGFIMFIVSYFVGNLFTNQILALFCQIIVGLIIYISLLLLSKDNFIYENIFCYLNKKKRKG